MSIEDIGNFLEHAASTVSTLGEARLQNPEAAQTRRACLVAVPRTSERLCGREATVTKETFAVKCQPWPRGKVRSRLASWSLLSSASCYCLQWLNLSGSQLSGASGRCWRFRSYRELGCSHLLAYGTVLGTGWTLHADWAWPLERTEGCWMCLSKVPQPKVSISKSAFPLHSSLFLHSSPPLSLSPYHTLTGETDFSVG